MVELTSTSSAFTLLGFPLPLPSLRAEGERDGAPSALLCRNSARSCGKGQGQRGRKKMKRREGKRKCLLERRGNTGEGQKAEEEPRRKEREMNKVWALFLSASVGPCMCYQMSFFFKHCSFYSTPTQ